ncbi:MAG: hypothetical protein R3A44_39790 [Caldilineaceae bacterium]
MSDWEGPIRQNNNTLSSSLSERVEKQGIVRGFTWINADFCSGQRDIGLTQSRQVAKGKEKLGVFAALRGFILFHHQVDHYNKRRF